MKTKRVYIKTYGCQMNVYDSRRMADVLAEGGYQPTDDASAADLVLLNTCHIREKAAEKLYSDVGRFRQLKESARHEGRDMILGVAGCVAQAEGLEIMRRQPSVDLVFGPQTYHRLNDLVGEVEQQVAAGRKPRVVDTEFPVEAKFDHLPRSGAQGVSAFLTIQEGCDKFCSFCVVPYTRGAEFSRPVADILREAEELVAKGAREITLLGQNVNAYHGGDGAAGEIGLGRLIRRLAEVSGLERIRYTTSHPRDLDDELIAAHRDVPECMPYIHLPVQSGSDSVLARMNRQHTSAHYLGLVERLRRARPDIAVSSDFIVGFPGESDAEFADTLRLVEEVRFAQAYSFKYSPRPGTPAAEAEGQIPEAIKSDRLATLQALLQTQQQAFNEGMVGQTTKVLFDHPGQRPGQLAGRSPYMQAVYADFAAPAKHLAGSGGLADVCIKKAGPNSLYGALTERSAA